jgi:hypothetical protein
MGSSLLTLEIHLLTSYWHLHGWSLCNSLGSFHLRTTGHLALPLVYFWIPHCSIFSTYTWYKYPPSSFISSFYIGSPNKFLHTLQSPTSVYSNHGIIPSRLRRIQGSRCCTSPPQNLHLRIPPSDNVLSVFQIVNHKTKLSHELLSGAAAFTAAHEYEKYVAKNGKPENHARAKELL